MRLVFSQLEVYFCFDVITEQQNCESDISIKIFLITFSMKCYTLVYVICIRVGAPYLRDLRTDA